MDRRTFVCALTGSPLAAPLAAEAQSAGKVWRIGWLAAGPILDNLDAFRSGLRALGYVEGHNIVIEPHYGMDQRNPLAVAAAEVVRINPDVIVTDGNAAAAAVKSKV